MSEDQLLCKVAALEASLELANSEFEKYERLYYLEKQKNEAVLELIEQYGGIDGAHHKQWVLDQIVRQILGPEEYEKWVEEMRGEYDEDEEMYEYDWDEGIAP